MYLRLRNHLGQQYEVGFVTCDYHAKVIPLVDELVNVSVDHPQLLVLFPSNLA